VYRSTVGKTVESAFQYPSTEAHASIIKDNALPADGKLHHGDVAELPAPLAGDEVNFCRQTLRCPGPARNSYNA
jgi:hypothetical protein